MKSVIDYRCEKCKHVRVLPKKEQRKRLLLGFLRETFVVLGVFFLLMVIINGPVGVAESFANGILTQRAHLDTEELRRVAINATELCVDERSTNSYCYAKHIYNALTDPELRYVPASSYQLFNKPSDIYAYGGDCKNMAFLYVSMMKSVGFEARMECKMEEGHCVAVVPHYVDFERMPGYAVVDLTLPGFFVMDDGVDIWWYRFNGTRWW